jgi:hypothetical protein
VMRGSPPRLGGVGCLRRMIRAAMRPSKRTAARVALVGGQQKSPGHKGPGLAEETCRFRRRTNSPRSARPAAASRPS